MKRYLITVIGRVQGVGFRFFVFKTARFLNLTGSVRNCDNGSVSIEAQGTDDAIEKLLERLQKGNGFSLVSDILMKRIEEHPKERSFNLIY